MPRQLRFIATAARAYILDAIVRTSKSRVDRDIDKAMISAAANPMGAIHAHHSSTRPTYYITHVMFDEYPRNFAAPALLRKCPVGKFGKERLRFLRFSGEKPNFRRSSSAVARLR